MSKISKKQPTAIIYQGRDGSIELRGDLHKETIWATQAQISEVFDVERSVVTKHIRNILAQNELDTESVCAKFAHTAKDGKHYQVQHYNLDVILAVGYRTNSLRAIQFRQWATKTLRQYIVDGYAINRKRIAANYTHFKKAVENIKHLLPAGSAVDSESVLELVFAFADTWLSLDAYDKDRLTTKGVTRKSVGLTVEQLSEVLGEFKGSLSVRGEASELFGVERSAGSVAGIVGSVMQTFDGQSLYPTLEEKAAHLLYFIIKDHPFIDGNKRNGAYAFVWFLQRTGLLDREKLTPPALTALTLLVAESDPKNKDRMIQVVLQLLKK